MGDYKEKLREIRESLDYWQEVSVIEFTEELARLMDEASVNQAELARRIGKSPAYISKVLNGNVNFTLKTMTKLALALDSIVHMHLAHKEAMTSWKDEFFEKSNSVLPVKFESEYEHTIYTKSPRLTLVGNESDAIQYEEVVNG